MVGLLVFLYLWKQDNDLKGRKRWDMLAVIILWPITYGVQWLITAIKKAGDE